MKVLVSNNPALSPNVDPNLTNCGGLVTDGCLVWIASYASGSDAVDPKPNIMCYHLDGLPAIDEHVHAALDNPLVVVPTRQMITLSDLFWLRRTVVLGTGRIVSIPRINPTGPSVSTIDRISLISFYQGLNGYFTIIGKDVTNLINFCVDHPEE